MGRPGDRATPLLSSPLRLGSVEVRNRIVFTAHGAFLDFYRPGHPGDQYLAYQERRAAGGTGLIILQPLHVHPSSQALGHYVYDPEDLRPKWTAMAEALHRRGAQVLVQLMHFGAQFRSDARRDLEPLWAFDDIQSPEGEPAHAMTPTEIEEVVDGFARAAALAVECGLDGVELHGAHGYLLMQSFSPWGNRRQDRWGEPARFVLDVLERVRAEIGREPVVGLRISVDDFRRREQGGLGPEGLCAVAAAVVDTGQLDYVSQSGGSRASHYARTIGSYRHPYGEWLHLAGRLREAIGAKVPVIAAGRVVTADLAEHALRDGLCDLVGMTRAQIADPDLAEKIVSGRIDRIRPCLGAAQGCVDRMEGGLAITCFHNPDAGREYRLEPLEPVAKPGRVLVVGGGPAGLKAAETAARRGHRVTLVERERELGGRLRAVRSLGPAVELLGSVLWLEQELEELAVEAALGVEVDEAYLRETAPDVVVLATGARPAPDRLAPADGSIPVVSTDDAATSTFRGQRVNLTGERVLVVDLLGSHEVALATEHLLDEGAAVTLVTPYLSLGARIGFTLLKASLERIYGLGCEVEASTLFLGIEGGRVLTRHVYTRREQRRAFDLVVAGVPGRPEIALAGAVEKCGARLLVAGDAVAPRSALHAFREGDNAGRAA